MVAVDPEGQPVVACNFQLDPGSFRASARSVMVCQWDGEEWRTLFEVSDVKYPSIGVDPEGGVIMAGESRGGGKVARWDGSKLDPFPPVPAGARPPGVRGLPVVILDPEGRPLVAWRERHRISRENSKGTEPQSLGRAVFWTGSEWVNVPIEFESAPEGSADSALTLGRWGNPCLVWWAISTDGAPHLLNIGRRFDDDPHPDAVLASDGRPWVSYESFYDHFLPEQVFVRRWNGQKWEEVGRGSGSGGGVSRTRWRGHAGDSSIAVDEAGRAYVAWAQEGRIYLRTTRPPE
jgi:hypothetical protein